MTKEEAQRIVKKVSCRCDGYGIVPGPNGAVKCPDCDDTVGDRTLNGHLGVSNDLFKEARKVLREPGWL